MVREPSARWVPARLKTLLVPEQKPPGPVWGCRARWSTSSSACNWSGPRGRHSWEREWPSQGWGHWRSPSFLPVSLQGPAGPMGDVGSRGQQGPPGPKVRGSAPSPQGPLCDPEGQSQSAHVTTLCGGDPAAPVANPDKACDDSDMGSPLGHFTVTHGGPAKMPDHRAPRRGGLLTACSGCWCGRRVEASLRWV